MNGEGLIGLFGSVAVDEHGDRLRLVARFAVVVSDREAADSRVIAGRMRGAVAGREVCGNRPVAAARTSYGNDGVAISFANRVRRRLEDDVSSSRCPIQDSRAS